MIPSVGGPSVELFLKCLGVLLISLIPRTLPKVVQFACGVLIVVLCVLDPAQLTILYIRKFTEFLMSYPMFAKLCSSRAGRWSLIVSSVYYVNRESALRQIAIIFIFCLYFLRVYELAMTATPNFLPQLVRKCIQTNFNIRIFIFQSISLFQSCTLFSKRAGAPDRTCFFSVKDRVVRNRAKHRNNQKEIFLKNL